MRNRSEWQVHFRETEVMMRFAKEYGYSKVEVESFESSRGGWQAWEGELCVLKPDLTKIYDSHDVHSALMSNSETGDVTAEAADVGTGARAEDYAGQDVKGKIVLGSGSASQLQRLGVFDHGAKGLICCSVMNPEGDSDVGVSSHISGTAPDGKKSGFGRNLRSRRSIGEC